ncbi:MAG: beta-ketoacyl-ACP synthase III [Hyphomonas sp.]|uniref:beta-ketoacyl-ACP synthase III n=1 Tax=Hyphomonas sp. TaxID=87 RepID=UPI0018044BD5|nr:beta-ketoacyl-ACP synthase III [Hyphomonas sp.]MBA3067085.1 beta-ketoacyl-ACP synthase III [Hyphomonas sp.]MBU3920256.1 beta-ketoacyl-ACP synthase III [Alphaproteobacteria bacterium]MBU4063119.1 beta-ketoacyl-ACP synthase III [Alphaproteobacteria bacterium]MBU4164436.1 beta-ketoacyl-ACP synthase III [Alphaproteobacteria bacterium]
MTNPVISATGLWTPPNSISNAELVESYNAWADTWNRENEAEIKSGLTEPKTHSSVEFIEKASGIKSRFVVDKDGIVDPYVMAPRIPERPNEQISVLAEMAVLAARDALRAAGRAPQDIGAVICAASNMQRAYPAMAIEVQQALGIEGFAFDMNVACSSATFGIQTAADFIRAGHARSVLMVNPEICSGHLNFTDRDSHFIFGDVATAVLIEAEDMAPAAHWKILGTKLKTQFSNNIRNNFGFLNRAAPEGAGAPDKLFMQEGRKVFREVVPMVAEMIGAHMHELGLTAPDLRRIWLHQANANMNRLIASKVLGREATDDESPTVLDTYANTSSAGSIIAFHKNSSDFKPGERGLICSFGAGYSAGTVFVERTE